MHAIFPEVGGRLEVEGPTGNTAWNFGWRPNYARIGQYLSTLPKPRFQDAAPWCMDKADRKAKADENALLWEACKIVTGGNLPAKKQRIGCCVSMGWSSGVDYRQCVDIALRHKVEEFRPISHAVMYGLARERGHMLGGGDGCYGAAAAEAVAKDGCLSNDEAKDSGNDDTLASQYGSRGVPSNLKELARKHLCGAPVLVKSAEECKGALFSGYPVPVCSNQGFAMQRDQDGYCRAEGSWSHCMVIVAYRADQNRFCIVQSWGQNTPSGPTSLGQPDNSFWADANVVNRMLSQEDSFAIPTFDGYPARDLDWYL